MGFSHKDFRLISLSSALDFLNKNRSSLEKFGYLMPRKLAHVNMRKAFDKMRLCYHNDNVVKDACSLSKLLMELAKRVQCARYEEFIIKLASAYDGYVFYLPAFMDFRGRIYRSGILHFHERDLARSFILFSNQQEESCKMDLGTELACSTAFKYGKFHSFNLNDAHQWYMDNKSVIYASDESLMKFAKGASEPFMFISKVLSHDTVNEYNSLPVTQDAAASAYQIMSYLLLNEEMAQRTNLLPLGKIQDVYLCLLDEIKEFLVPQINNNDMMQIIESKFDRKLIKKLFMPLIYGKTVISMAGDLKDKYGDLLSPKDMFDLAKLCYQFWCHKYPDIVNLMKLIRVGLVQHWIGLFSIVFPISLLFKIICLA